jgi:hypothetical protein
VAHGLREGVLRMTRCATCGLETETPDGACDNCVQLRESSEPSDVLASGSVDATSGDVPVALAAISPGTPAGAGWQSRHVAAIGTAVLLGGIVAVSLFSTGSAAREEHAASDSRVARPMAPLAPSRAPRATPTIAHVWSNTNQLRWVSNHPKSVAFELTADHDVPVWMRRVQPLLVVRCLAHKADAFVFTDSPARIEAEDENHSVRVAFDNEAEATERWMDSEEHDALFAPNGASFARRLAQSHTLRFSFTPHNAAQVTVLFTTTGFDKILERVAENCRM